MSNPEIRALLDFCRLEASVEDTEHYAIYDIGHELMMGTLMVLHNTAGIADWKAAIAKAVEIRQNKIAIRDYSPRFEPSGHWSRYHK